jgi:protein O-GlcNAc transferase
MTKEQIPTIQEAIDLGVQHHNAGDLPKAESIYQQILQADLNQPVAMHLLGVIAHQVGKNDISVDLISKALTIKPDFAEAHSNLGNVLQELGKLDEAVASCNKAIAIKPNFAEAHYNLGLALQGLGQPDEAVASYYKAIAIKPDYTDAYSNLGLTLQGFGKLDEAVASYNKALAIKPNFAEAHSNLGNALYMLGQLDEAVASYSKAIIIKPDYFEAHFNLSNALNELGRHDEAVACYNKTIVVKPDYAEAYSNLGNAFQALGNFDEAVIRYHRALTIKPDMFEAYFNLSNALQGLGQLDEAVTSCKKVLTIKPDNSACHSNILQTEQYRLGQNSKNLYKIHKDWDKRHAQRFQATWPKHLNTPDIGRILRIGFVSPDLGRHPVGYFLVQFFEKILKTEIETVIYSNRLIHNLDDLSDRIKAASSFWRDVNGIPDDKLAKIILGDKIDILFDLTGHFSENRLLLFARKPAPIQVSWAGYVGTTGLSAMDYLLSDIHSTPLDEEKYYSEQIIRMAAWICYEPPAYAPEVGPSPFKKNGHMTFSSFCNPAKINEEVISVWAIIMNKIEGSCLIIKYKGIDSAANIKRLRTKFEAQGIDKSRLTLEGKSSHVDLLARYNDVDITLDTFPYSGGLTTFESLWMGVPVISVPGKTFASRHSLSHLSTIGLPELVAKDKDDYVRLTVELAKDAERMVELRVGLRSRMANSPICDGDKFSRNFTTLMKKIWRDWCFTQDK